jgi:hypothetical protein
MEGEIMFRIVVLRPLPGVQVGVQRGHDELLLPAHADDEMVTFEFSLRLAQRHDGITTLRGPEAQGGPADRFVYVNWGVRAGDKESRWDRRAKVPLKDLTSAELQEALMTPGAFLEAQIDGVGDDGGPAAASVTLAGGGWRLVRPAA